MGWTYTSQQNKSDFLQEILRDCHWENDSAVSSVIDHSVRGNRLWVALRLEYKNGYPDCKYVVLFLLHKHKDGWGYKDMDESMGPYYYDCPLRLLQVTGDPAPCTAHETHDEDSLCATLSSLRWRQQVREQSAKRRRSNRAA